MSECGCRIWHITREGITFCSLHAHAGELREALEQAVNTIHGEFCGARCRKEHKRFLPILAKSNPGQEKI